MQIGIYYAESEYPPHSVMPGPMHGSRVVGLFKQFILWVLIFYMYVHTLLAGSDVLGEGLLSFTPYVNLPLQMGYLNCVPGYYFYLLLMFCQHAEECFFLVSIDFLTN